MGALQCGWDLGASQPSERAVGSQESREAWNRRGSSRREDELLRQGGDVRKEEGQMGKLGRSGEGCRQQEMDLYCDAPPLHTPPPPLGLRPSHSTFGGCPWPPDCLGRGLTAGREKGDGWGTFLPVGLWERKEKKKQRALVIWFCSENPVIFLVLIVCPPSTALHQQGSSDLTSCLTIIPSFIHSLNTYVCVCV